MYEIELLTILSAAPPAADPIRTASLTPKGIAAFIVTAVETVVPTIFPIIPSNGFFLLIIFEAIFPTALITTAATIVARNHPCPDESVLVIGLLLQ